MMSHIPDAKSELHLSTAAKSKDNVDTLVSALKATSGSLAPISASDAHTPSSFADIRSHSQHDARSMDVFVELHVLQRQAFLELALDLYVAALEQFPDMEINVIPVVARSRSEEVSGLETLGQNDMRSAAEVGFQPLYDYVAVGGTFDHLHSGHKLMLTTAALYASKRLLIGVASDALLQRKTFREYLQPLDTRKAALRKFMSRIRCDLEIHTSTITDVTGSTDTIKELQALVVSPETKSAIAKINEARDTNGKLAPLAPICVPHVKTSDGLILSSSQIRERQKI